MSGGSDGSEFWSINGGRASLAATRLEGASDAVEPRTDPGPDR